MNSQEIRDAIAASPALQALAAVRDDSTIAATLSAGRTKVIPKIITSRGIASTYPGGPFAAEAVLMKLEGARDFMLQSTDTITKVFGSLLRRQLAFLATEGLDFGDATLRGMLDQFASQAILTSTEATNLKSMALVADPISTNAVSIALNEVAPPVPVIPPEVAAGG